MRNVYLHKMYILRSAVDQLINAHKHVCSICGHNMDIVYSLAYFITHTDYLILDHWFVTDF